MTRSDHKQSGDPKYSALKWFIVACLAGYVAIAVSFNAFGREPYFFFSWFVFSRVPSEAQIGYDVRLLSADGKDLEKPASLLELRGTYSVEGINAPEYRRRFGIFSRTYGDPRSQDKRLIDALIVAESARYEFVRQSFNPVERWKTGAIATTTVLGTFEKNR